MTASPLQLMIRITGLVLALLIACIFTGTAVRAATAPGTVIISRAEIAWFDTASGTVMRSLSNASTVKVLGVHRFALEGPGDTVAHAAKFLGLSYRILNTGNTCLLYTSPSPRDATLSRMPSSA